MLPYLLLIFVPLAFSMATYSKANGRGMILIGGNREIVNHSFMLPVFFFILILLLSLRDISIGNDTANYKYYFELFSKFTLKKVFQTEMDILYVLFNWIVSRFTEDYQIFLTITAIIAIFPIAALYCEDRENGFLKLILFINMSIFVMLFSGLRQALAISMGAIAFEFVKRKNFWGFLIFSFIALGFHHTGFMVFLYYPLYHVTFRKKHLWFIIPVVLLVYLFNAPIFNGVASILNNIFGEKYSVTIDRTGAYTMLLVFIIFAVLAYVMPKEKSMDRETLGLRNLLVFAVVLQCFAPIHTLAMRMNYYYILFIPIIMPKILRPGQTISDSGARFIKIGLMAFFTIYYLWTTYNSCRTGISAMHTYPYVPFWH